MRSFFEILERIPFLHLSGASSGIERRDHVRIRVEGGMRV